ncbi:MAG: hypothetical protein OWU32_07865 [Firmicutes bacterium]|nr:hypothetical protein [Bacillota bacterium]
MWSDILWGVALVVLVICVVIQRRALNRIAFGRSMFISGMSFVVSFVVMIAPPSAGVWVLFGLFELFGWTFLIFMTVRSIARLRQRVQPPVTSSRPDSV